MTGSISAPNGSLYATALGNMTFAGDSFAVGGTVDLDAGLVVFDSIVIAFFDTTDFVFSTFGGLLYLDGASLDLSNLTSVPTTLMSLDEVSEVVGTYDGLAEGAVLSLLGDEYQISYFGGDGNDVTLTRYDAPIEVPLPATGLLLLGGLAGLAAYRKKRA